jgi:hypothetical protein
MCFTGSFYWLHNVMLKVENQNKSFEVRIQRSHLIRFLFILQQTRLICENYNL